MHIVTKVLVVFAAVLSLLLGALTMAYSANVDKVLNKQRDLENANEQLKATADQGVAQANEENSRLQGEIQSLSTRLSQYERQIRELQNERTSLINEREIAQSESKTVIDKITALVAANETQAALIQALRDETLRLRDDKLQASRREIALTDRINELESQSEVLVQSNRALQEQIAEVRVALDQARNGVQGSEGEAVIRPGPPLRARVVETSVDKATGKILARINAGTNDNVHENMLFYIARDDQTFVGNLIILQTDLQSAVGEVQLTDKTGLKVQPNDLVLSGFGARG